MELVYEKPTKSLRKAYEKQTEGLRKEKTNRSKFVCLGSNEGTKLLVKHIDDSISIFGPWIYKLDRYLSLPRYQPAEKCVISKTSFGPNGSFKIFAFSESNSVCFYAKVKI